MERYKEDEFARMDATEQASLVRAGKVSPKELVQAAIDRIEALNPKLNAVVWKRFDQAIADAESNQLPDGPFRGVPILKKGSGLATADEPDWEASKFLQSVDYRSKETGVFAERIIQAGFISLGHSNTPEFAAQGTTEPILYGPTRNPWNLERSAGGSSGGAACAVASMMVPVAQSTDGAGSTRIPASAIGVVGLKPSRGRISYAPFRSDWFDLSTTYGFITRTIRDLAACMDFAQGPAPGDTLIPMPPAQPYLNEIRIAPKKLRIGLWTAPPRALPLPVHAECIKAAEATAKLLASLGHSIDLAHPKALDEDNAGALMQGYVPLKAFSEILRFEEEIGRKVTEADVEPLTWMMLQLARNTSLESHCESMRNIYGYTRRTLSWWNEKQYDLLLCPTNYCPPPKLGDLAPRKGNINIPLWTGSGYWFNLTGQPAISLPMHWTADGLPVGVMLVANIWREDLLFQTASQLEQASPWMNKVPVLDNI